MILNIFSFLIVALVTCSTSFAADQHIQLKRLEQTQMLALAQEINDGVHRYIHASSNIDDFLPSKFKSLILRAVRSQNPADDRYKKRRFLNAARAFFSGLTLTEPLTDESMSKIKYEGHYLTRVSESFKANKTSQKGRAHKDGTPYTRIELIEWAAKNAVLFGIGNCGEMADLAFTLLLEYPALRTQTNIASYQEIKMLIVGTERQLGHDYVMLIGPYQTKVIIDPWVDEVFMLEDHDAENQGWLNMVSYEKDGQRVLYNNFVVATAYVGQGHSTNWLVKRHARGESILLGDWVPSTIRFTPMVESEMRAREHLRFVNTHSWSNDIEPLIILRIIDDAFPNLISFRLSNFLSAPPKN